jgi:hypothetical protein
MFDALLDSTTRSADGQLGVDDLAFSRATSVGHEGRPRQDVL